MTSPKPTLSVESLYATLQLPSEARLDQRVPKKLFLEQLTSQPGTTAADKKLVREDLEEFRWLATLKPASSGLAASVSDTHEYLEIAVLSVQMRNQTRSERPSVRMTQLIHRVVPYPVLLLLQTPETLSLSLAHKRRTLTGEAGKFVLEELRSVPFTGPRADHNLSEVLLPSLALSVLSLPSRTMWAAYSSWIARFVAYDSARWLRRFQRAANLPVFSSDAQIDQHREAQRELARLQREETLLRNRLKGEKQLGRKVEWNTALKQLLQRRTGLLDVLESNIIILADGEELL